MKRRAKGANTPLIYHAWITANMEPARMMYRLAKPFNSAAAARQWARRRYPAERITVMQSHETITEKQRETGQ